MTKIYLKNQFSRYWPVLLGIILMAIPMVAFAADEKTNQVLTQTFEFFALILTGMQAVLWPILLLMGGLLNNDLLFSGGMQTILLNIWTAVRDFVNVMFVLGLLFVAIINILGAGKDEYTVTKVLPKIAISLIAVNFSFLACKVVLDAVNITTTAIFAIPLAQDTIVKYNDDKARQDLSNKFCNKIMSVPDIENAAKNDQGSGLMAYCKKDDAASTTDPTTKKVTNKYKLTDLGINFFKTFNSSNVALVMALELMSITNQDTINYDQVKDFKSLAISTIFSIIFLVIYATSFIALFVVLLVRIVVLWISIATMPISFVGMAFTKVHDKIKDTDPWTLFLTHATTPIKVSIVLTIGMIMISQLKQITPGVQFSTNPNTLGAYTSSASTLQDLIAGFATAAFIWMAAFSAMKGTKADTIVNTIESKVKGFGKSLAKLPLYAPIIPTAKGKVGLAALGGSGGLAGGLDKYYSDLDAKWRESPEDQAKAKLEKAKKEDLPGIVASILRDTNNAPSEALQKQIYAKLKEFGYDKKIKKFGKYASAEEALKAMEKGEISIEDWKDFLKQNPDYKAPAFDTKDTKAKAGSAMQNAKAAGVQIDSNTGAVTKGSGMTALDKAAAELASAIKALEGNKDEKETENLAKKVQEYTQKVESLTSARAAITPDGKSMGFSAASVINTQGAVTSGANAEKIKSGYEKLNQEQKVAVREMLINKVRETLPEDKKAQAEAIVDDIIQNGKDAKGLVPPTPTK